LPYSTLLLPLVFASENGLEINVDHGLQPGWNWRCSGLGILPKGPTSICYSDKLSEVEHLKNLGLDILPLDVVDEASIKKAVESLQALTGGTLDFLVNNAGSGT
jgi:hypothetical protein